MQAKRILIVDDEASLRTALFRALDRRGYQVITAASKKEAENLLNIKNTLEAPAKPAAKPSKPSKPAAKKTPPKKKN